MKLLSIGAAAVPTTLLMAALLAPASLPADDALLKCKAPAAGLHVILDGRFLERDQYGKVAGLSLKKGDTDFVAVMCWDPVKQMLYWWSPEESGAGEGLIHITTNEFVAGVHEDLERIVAAQDEFRKENAHSAANLADLDVAMQMNGVTYTVSRGDDGWEATAGNDLLLDTCHVFAGSITPSREGLEDRVPACIKRREFAPKPPSGGRP